MADPKAERQEMTGKVLNLQQLCFCGCGSRTSSKNIRFRQGHDAKLKSILNRVKRNELPAMELPKCLGYACIDSPSLSVVGFDAPDILRMFAQRPRYGDKE